MLAASSIHLHCGSGGQMETRDEVVSLVGYLVFLAMALAVVAAAITGSSRRT